MQFARIFEKYSKRPLINREQSAERGCLILVETVSHT
jgi:hypothetical protein